MSQVVCHSIILITGCVLLHQLLQHFVSCTFDGLNVILASLIGKNEQFFISHSDKSTSVLNISNLLWLILKWNSLGAQIPFHNRHTLFFFQIFSDSPILYKVWGILFFFSWAILEKGVTIALLQNIHHHGKLCI